MFTLLGMLTIFWVKILSISHLFHFFHYQSIGNIKHKNVTFGVQIFFYTSKYFKTLVMERKNGEDFNSYFFGCSAIIYFKVMLLLQWHGQKTMPYEAWKFQLAIKFTFPISPFFTAILANLKRSLRRSTVLMLHPNFHPVQKLTSSNQLWSQRIKGRK